MTTASPRGRRRRRSLPSRLLRRVTRGSNRLATAVLGLGLVVALAAVAVALGGGRGPADQPTPPAATTPASSALPSLPALTTGPDASGGAAASLPPLQSVSPSAPAVGVVAKRISIERLGIDLPIVEGDGYEAPMFKAAHYPGTGWPHGGTNIYIYAHAQAGMFLPLWGAQVGDVVKLRLADGTDAVYQVTQVLPQVAWNALEYTDPTPPERLTLQTSTGYTATSPRFVVIAEPVTSANASAAPSASAAP